MKTALLFACLLAAACERPGPEPEPPRPPIPPTPVEDADCATACENQRHLGCELGEPTAEGSTCEEVCEVSFNAGVRGLEWDVEKLSRAIHCE